MELLIAQSRGLLSKEDEKTIEAYLKANPEAVSYINDCLEIIRQSGHFRLIHRMDQAKAWDVIKRQMHRHRNQASYKRWMKVAAVFVPLAIAVVFYVTRLIDSNDQLAQVTEVMSSVRELKAELILATGEVVPLRAENVGATIVMDGVNILVEEKGRISYTSSRVSTMHSLLVPRGGEYQLVLPDGTTVWMNADSRLDYPTVFSDSKREVILLGEAYFEVAQDADWPFIVRSSDMVITVTGTSFNLHNYPGEPAHTTLVEGGITVSSQLSPAVKLQPGEQACLGPHDRSFTVRRVNTGYYTSWILGVFDFQNITLEELSARMERWYDVEIEFLNENVGKVRLTGAMEKDEPIELLLRLIERATNVSYVIEGRKIFIG